MTRTLRSRRPRARKETSCARTGRLRSRPRDSTRAVWRKPKADKSGMHVIEESSSCIVPAKYPNKSARPLAEGTEGRQLAKENAL